MVKSLPCTLHHPLLLEPAPWHSVPRHSQGLRMNAVWLSLYVPKIWVQDGTGHSPATLVPWRSPSRYSSCIAIARGIAPPEYGKTWNDTGSDVTQRDLTRRQQHKFHLTICQRHHGCRVWSSTSKALVLRVQDLSLAMLCGILLTFSFKFQHVSTRNQTSAHSVQKSNSCRANGAHFLRTWTLAHLKLRVTPASRPGSICSMLQLFQCWLLLQGFESESASFLFLEAPLSHLRASRTVECSTHHWLQLAFQPRNVEAEVGHLPRAEVKSKDAAATTEDQELFLLILQDDFNCQKEGEKTQCPKSNHCSWPSHDELM